MSYDPNKQYSWTNEDKFVLNGQDFGIVLNALRAILSTEDAARVLLANKASSVIEQLLAKKVEEGIVNEVIPPGSQAPIIPEVIQPPKNNKKSKLPITEES
jgi:hypothetical protein